MSARFYLCTAITITFFSTINLVLSVQASEEKQPAPQLAQLEYFQGRRICQGKGIAPSSLREIELVWNVKRDFNRFWYVGQAQQKKSKANPHPIRTQEIFYDTAAKHFIRAIVTSGGELVNFTSPGWQAEKLVWEGTVVTGGQKILLREMITKRSKEEFKATYYDFIPVQRKWQPAGEEICKQQG